MGYLVTRPESCTYTIDFANLPADDKGLQDWLGAQPGVRNATVRREGQTLTVAFELSAGSAPNVVTQARELGYGGLKRYSVKRGGRPWPASWRP
jgi:hypothetical protein